MIQNEKPLKIILNILIESHSCYLGFPKDIQRPLKTPSGTGPGAACSQADEVGQDGLSCLMGKALMGIGW